MADTYKEVTTKSWGSRIGEAIKGVLVGIILVGLSCVGLFWNEGRAVQTAKSLAEGAGLVVNIDPGRIDPATEGKLVHVTGAMNAGIKPSDSDFGVSVDGLRLLRTVEMYQWSEEKKTETKKNLGGSEEQITTYSYVRVWSGSEIDSSRFKVSDGHANPAMRYNDASFVGGDVTLGAFHPGERIVLMLPASQDVRVDSAMAEELRKHVTGPVQANDGKFYFGVDPSHPSIGDMRVSYRLVPAGPVSIVGRQTGSDFTDYQTSAGDTLLIVRPGSISAADMFKAAKRGNKIFTWIIRGVGTVAMFIGFSMILAPLVVLADVVPLIGTLLGGGASLVSLVATALVAPLVIAIAWFWYRPLVGVAVLVGGVILAVGFTVLARRKTAARQTAPA